MSVATGRFWKCWHCGTIAAQEIIFSSINGNEIRWVGPHGTDECAVCHSWLFTKDQS